jgi:hypothetical protein
MVILEPNNINITARIVTIGKLLWEGMSNRLRNVEEEKLHKHLSISKQLRMCISKN